MHLAINGWFWDQPNTGSGQYLGNLLPALLAQDPHLRVSLVTPRPAEDLPARVTVQHIPPPLPGHLGKVWFEQRSFPAACAGADLAHIPYWGPPLRTPAPFVVTVHDIIPLLLPAYRGSPLARLYTALVQAATRGAAWIFTDSEAARQDILDHLGADPARVQAVHLAASHDFHPTGPAEEAARVRARYGLPERFVLYLGGFDPRKNLATLLAAYAYVRDAVGESVPLVLAGKASSKAVERLALDDSVHLTGWVDEADKPALMRQAACFVFPSVYEGFGLPPLEAMACGTPVVAVDAASLPEVVGDAGFLVAPDDERAMAGAILAILTQDDLAESLRMRGLAQAARFSWARAAQATRRGYDAVLG